MVAVSEVFKAWKEGLANKDSSKLSTQELYDSSRNV